MGELGLVPRYHYWSDRRVQQIAADYDIALTGRSRWALRFPNLPFIAQLELGQEAGDLPRNEVARRIETVIGLHAVEDFVTPPPSASPRDAVTSSSPAQRSATRPTMERCFAQR